MNAIRPSANLRTVFEGVLLGTAVGDSLGLPAEGMSKSRINRRWKRVWKHRFIGRAGMCSDDTEHAFFVAQALLAHPDDVAAFQNCLAWKLKFWLLGLPGGIGLATLRAILKLWIGFPPSRSGVFSAGNGPSMRSALLGAYFADDPAKRRAFVAASTRITHTDPRAETAAMAVAEAAVWAVQKDSVECLLNKLILLDGDEAWLKLCDKLAGALKSQLPVEDFAESLGLKNGVSGFAYHTVPVAIYAMLRHPDDFRAALESALNCGGDTDTVGAIVGALRGVRQDTAGIPMEWLDGIWEWPRSKRLLAQAAEQLEKQKENGRASGPVSYFWPALIVRNLLFILIVLAHGFRRLAPPY